MKVEFPSGADRIGGALYRPAGVSACPGVVVIPDVRGLYDHYHDVARRIADAGFAALAVDLYARTGPPSLPDMESVFRFMRELPDRQVLGDLQAAIDYLAARPECSGRRIGITGFCMGGKYALLAAARCRNLAAAVPWYGMLRAPVLDEANPEHPLDVLADVRCPLLALFGEDDPVVPLVDVEELERRVQRGGLDCEIVVYPGAGHAFANESRPDAYRPAAAADAWSRALRFLHARLDGAGPRPSAPGA